VRIFEYQPAMIHSKVLVVDDLWSVVGTTNIDNRSFEHNDEVNAVIRDAEIAARLKEWKAPPPRYTSGVMAKYARLVSSAAEGAVTG